MKQAVLHPDLSVTFENDVNVPTPKDFEVIIKAETASCNPVDWKAASRQTTPSQASGKDFAGIVQSVGSRVFQLKEGDRVGALNHVSGFAEYSIGPGFTTFKLPENVSFEEAAAFGLPYYTAALALFKNMPTPAPWSPARPSDSNPLLIYGASSAVGAYAVKLAVLANVHPIVAVAGAAAKDTIADVLKPEYGDTVIDYREHKTSDALVAAIKAAIPHSQGVKFGFDVIGTEFSIGIFNSVLDKTESFLANAVPSSPTSDLPQNTVVSKTFAPGLFTPSDAGGDKGPNGRNNEGSRAFASVATRYLEFALGEGLIKPHPFRVLPDGLSSLREGLLDLKEGRNKSLKYIFRVSETKW